MKTFLNKIAILAVLVFSAGCSDTDTFVDEVFETTTRGTVLKTIDTDLDFEVGEENVISVSAEVIDQRGQDLEKIDAYLSFTDNRDSSDPDNISRDEELFETFTAEELDNSGEYPVLNFSFTGDEFDSFFGIDETQYDQGGRIRIRFALVMNDGRVFSSDNLNNVVSGGAFYRSPFQYSMSLICAPAPPAVGTWTVELQDSFGDGWNGGEVVVDVDGNETRLTIDDGAAATETFEVPSGSEVLSITYSSGDWDGEVTFQVITPDGTEIVDAGTSPPVALELLDYCSLSYRE